jgi:hypothetical protein
VRVPVTGVNASDGHRVPLFILGPCATSEDE